MFDLTSPHVRKESRNRFAICRLPYLCALRVLHRSRVPAENINARADWRKQRAPRFIQVSVHEIHSFANRTHRFACWIRFALKTMTLQRRLTEQQDCTAINEIQLLITRNGDGLSHSFSWECITVGISGSIRGTLGRSRVLYIYSEHSLFTWNSITLRESIYERTYFRK